MIRLIQSTILSLIISTLVSTTAFGQLEFIENKGQWPGKFGLRAKMSHGDLWLSGNQVAFVLSDFGMKPDSKLQHPHGTLEKAKDHCYTVEYVGANPAVQLLGQDKKLTYHNYFISNNPDQWKSNVALYSVANHKEIYNKTDLVWKEEKGNLKYEFRLAAGAVADEIKMKYKGLDRIEIKQGKLNLYTTLGMVTEMEPYAFQSVNGKNKKIVCRYQRIENDVISFEFPNGYDHSKELVIDPVLVFSGFSGSRSDNWGYTATYGENGTTYSAGLVLGPRFQITTGAFQPIYAGDSTVPNSFSTCDIGILKFSSDGGQLLFSTYLGGAEAEIPASMVVGKDNHLVLLGATSSADFPTSLNAYDKTFNGGINVTPLDPNESGIRFRQGSDIVISKFSPDGTQLVGSTFLGGSNNDGVLTFLGFGNSQLVRNYGDAFRGEVALDSAGKIYIASHTLSTNFPVVTPLQAAKSTGIDGICARFNPDLTSLEFSTYLGGNADDGAFSIQVTNLGTIYLAGGTASSNFPRTAGSIKPAFGGTLDGFVCRFNPSIGLTSLRSSYLGTSAYDQAYFVQLDNKNSVYVYGQTKGNYPVSIGVYNNPNSGQFIHCLSPNLDTTRFSTVFGSGENNTNISPTAFLVDDCGRIYCSGWGGIVNQSAGYQNGSAFGLKTTPNAYGRSTNGSEFYVLVLEKNATALSFATYFGDTLGGFEHVDGGTSRFDKKGIVYQAVCACGNTQNFPVTPGVFSNTNQSFNCNNAVFKYDFSLLKAGFQSSTTQACAGNPIKFTSNSVFASSYKWDFGAGHPPVTILEDTIQFTYDTAGTFLVKLVAINPEACPNLDSIYKTIMVQKVPAFNGDSISFCSFGDTLQLPTLPSGNYAYSWLPEIGLSNAGIRNPKVINPQQTIIYQATVKSTFGCGSQNTFKVSNGVLISKAKADTLKGCKPLDISFYNNSYQANGSTWYWGNGDSTQTNNDTTGYTFNQPGNYQVLLKVKNDTTCLSQHYDTLHVAVFALPEFSDSLNRYCVDGNLILKPGSNIGKTFSWSPALNLNDSTLKNPVFQNAQPAVFQLTILDSNQCKAIGKLEIRDGRLKANFDLSTDNVCVPSNISLINQSVNPQKSRWIWNGDSTEVLENNIVPVTANTSGVFQIKLKVLSDTTCKAFDEIQKTILLGGIPAIPTTSQVFCPGDTVLVSALKKPGYQYVWPSNFSVLPDASKATILRADTLSVTIGLKDSLQCPGNQNIILIPAKPKAEFVNESKFEICLDILKYGFNGTTENVDYLWRINDQNLIGRTVEYQFPSRGNYPIQLIVNRGGCRDTIQKNVEVNDAPLVLEAKFEANPLLVACNELPVMGIKNQSIGTTKVIWSWDGNYSYESVPLIRVTEAKTLKITLDAYQGFCLKSLTKEVEVKPVSPPNLITANHDGKNDVFVIQNLPENSRLDIRDRWGNSIFSSDNYKNDWQPEEKFGTGFFELKLPGGGGCNGWIQVVR